MTTTWIIECDIRFDRKGRGSRKVLANGPRPHRQTEPGRVPRVARLMALAIRLERRLREGVFESYSELAALGQVTRARVSQIMNLLNLAPDIQEAILFLPRTLHGRDPIHLRPLQPIATTLDWRKQRRRLERIAGENRTAGPGHNPLNRIEISRRDANNRYTNLAIPTVF
ncbi:MAG: hypothetical protein N2039_09945 [Gemmataceae bacterium]|nr:hypothetical protein [Gemmataceae bacterium]